MDMFQIVWGSSLLTLMVLAPGFAVSMAVFPKPGQVSLVERIGLSLVFGLIPQLVMYFLAKNLSVPITSTTATLSIAGICAAGVLVYRQRVSV